MLEQPDAGDSGLVETPENQKPPKPKRTRKPKAPKPVEDAPADKVEAQPKGDTPDAPEAAE